MANNLTVANVLSIQALYRQGWSQRRIARELGVSRDAVATHLQSQSKPTKSPTGSDQTPDESKPANAPTGSRSTGKKE